MLVRHAGHVREARAFRLRALFVRSLVAVHARPFGHYNALLVAPSGGLGTHFPRERVIDGRTVRTLFLAQPSLLQQLLRLSRKRNLCETAAKRVMSVTTCLVRDPHVVFGGRFPVIRVESSLRSALQKTSASGNSGHVIDGCGGRGLVFGDAHN